MNHLKELNDLIGLSAGKPLPEGTEDGDTAPGGINGLDPAVSDNPEDPAEGEGEEPMNDEDDATDPADTEQAAVVDRIKDILSDSDVEDVVPRTENGVNYYDVVFTNGRNISLAFLKLSDKDAAEGDSKWTMVALTHDEMFTKQLPDDSVIDGKIDPESIDATFITDLAGKTQDPGDEFECFTLQNGKPVKGTTSLKEGQYRDKFSRLRKRKLESADSLKDLFKKLHQTWENLMDDLQIEEADFRMSGNTMVLEVLLDDAEKNNEQIMAKAREIAEKNNVVNVPQWSATGPSALIEFQFVVKEPKK